MSSHIPDVGYRPSLMQGTCPNSFTFSLNIKDNAKVKTKTIFFHNFCTSKQFGDFFFRCENLRGVKSSLS